MAWDKEHFKYNCTGCPEKHNSIWATLIESREWDLWVKENKRKMQYDVYETEDCGWMSAKHWNSFIKFIKNAKL